MGFNSGFKGLTSDQQKQILICKTLTVVTIRKVKIYMLKLKLNLLSWAILPGVNEVAFIVFQVDAT